MAVAVTTELAVIAVCERCGERSSPLDPRKVEEWRRSHDERHEREDLMERMAQRGHTITLFIDNMDMDWLDCHTQCSCRWRGSQWGARGGALEEAFEHLKEEAQRLADAA